MYNGKYNKLKSAIKKCVKYVGDVPHCCECLVLYPWITFLGENTGLFNIWNNLPPLFKKGGWMSWTNYQRTLEIAWEGELALDYHPS